VGIGRKVAGMWQGGGREKIKRKNLKVMGHI
jgi:hypothetical protein